MEVFHISNSQGIRQEKELTQIINGAGITFSGKLAEGLLKYSYLLVFARILGKDMFGLFWLGVIIVTFAARISMLGLDNGVIRYIALYNSTGDMKKVKGTIVQSLKLSFFVGVLAGIMVFAFAEPLSLGVFHKPALGAIMKSLSISVPFAAVAMVALACTHGFQVMKYKAYIQNMFWPACNMFVALLFILMGKMLDAVVIGNVLSAFFSLILSLYYLNKIFPLNSDLTSVIQTRTLLRFSSPLLLMLTFTYLINWTDALMIGSMRSSGEVGIYYVAMRISLLTVMILESIRAVFAPMISDLYSRDERQKLENVFKKVTAWAFASSLPISLLIGFLSKDIMTIFGQEFASGWSSLVILTFAQLLSISVGTAGLVLVMSGKQDLMLYNTAGICLANILLNLLLIPRYGIVGASIASGISIILLNILMTLELYILLKMHPFSISMCKSVISGLIALLVIGLVDLTIFDVHGISKILIYTPIFLISFTFLLYVLGFDVEDKYYIMLFKMKLLKIFK